MMLGAFAVLTSFIPSVPRDADDNAIKKAYRKLTVLVHPDKCSHPRAEEAFKAVNESYQVCGSVCVTHRGSDLATTDCFMGGKSDARH